MVKRSKHAKDWKNTKQFVRRACKDAARNYPIPSTAPLYLNHGKDVILSKHGYLSLNDGVQIV